MQRSRSSASEWPRGAQAHVGTGRSRDGSHPAGRARLGPQLRCYCAPHRPNFIRRWNRSRPTATAVCDRVQRCALESGSGCATVFHLLAAARSLVGGAPEPNCLGSAGPPLCADPDSNLRRATSARSVRTQEDFGYLVESIANQPAARRARVPTIGRPDQKFRGVVIRLAVRPSAAERPKQQRDNLETALDSVASRSANTGQPRLRFRSAQDSHPR